MLRRVVHALYFAYGSNLSSRRMRDRVPGARARGRARLAGFRLVADKPGRDGSAKLDVVPDPAGCVWGALWELDAADLARLDRYEGGYARVDVTVDSDAGALAATTYASEVRGAPPGLEPDYKAFVLEGAREHGLPAEWVAHLASLPER
jgi:gamma-glutamylcyclotransferase (GGCT)/AIG2-like uncharacterized protein YtfP